MIFNKLLNSHNIESPAWVKYILCTSLVGRKFVRINRAQRFRDTDKFK